MTTEKAERAIAALGKRRNKYGVRLDPVGIEIRTVDGIRFDSAREARRYGELKLLERAGEIAGLELQKRFPLRVEGKLICTWICDFVYADVKTRRLIAEDCKGVRTPVFCMKSKLFAALHPEYDVRLS